MKVTWSKPHDSCKCYDFSKANLVYNTGTTVRSLKGREGLALEKIIRRTFLGTRGVQGQDPPFFFSWGCRVAAQARPPQIHIHSDALSAGQRPEGRGLHYLRNSLLGG